MPVDKINDNDWILELEDIEKDSGNIQHRKHKCEREIKGVRHRFETGNVLFSKLRTYLNKVLIAPTSGYCSTEIIPINCCDCVTPEYLCAWMRAPFFLSYTIECGYGVKMPRLSTSDAKKGIIPLPPLNEQVRIMGSVRHLFRILDSVTNSLYRI